MPSKFKAIEREMMFCSADQNGGVDFKEKTTLLIEDGRRLILLTNHRTELPSIREEMDDTWEHAKVADLKACK